VVVVEVVDVVAGVVVVVAVVGSVVSVAVLAVGDPVAAAPVDATGVPPELPQAPSAVTPSSVAASSSKFRVMRRGSGIAMSGPSPCSQDP
jgi:hypothetical protein